MKLSLLLAAGLVGLATPSFAQNFTIPAGDSAFAAGRPQVDTSANLVAIAPAYHGRSVTISHSHGVKAAPRGE